MRLKYEVGLAGEPEAGALEVREDGFGAVDIGLSGGIAGCLSRVLNCGRWFGLLGVRRSNESHGQEKHQERTTGSVLATVRDR